jgi:hypothetical protein
MAVDFYIGQDKSLKNGAISLMDGKDWYISQNNEEYWVNCLNLSGRVNKKCEEGIEIFNRIKQWKEDLEQLQPGELCLVDPVGDYLKGLTLKHADLKKILYSFKRMKQTAHQEGVKDAQKAMRKAFGFSDYSPYSSGGIGGEL